MKKQNKQAIDDDDDSNEEPNIGSHENNIYFYDDVNTKNIYTLNKLLEEVKTNIINKSLNDKNIDYINLYINSNGGGVYAGLSAMSYIQNLGVDVYTYVDGFVASAATFILLGGKYIYMQKYSNVLIHQMSTGFWGKFDELLDEVANSKIVMNNIKLIYHDNCSLPIDVVNILFKKDVYLTSDECLKYGIINEIY